MSSDCGASGRQTESDAARSSQADHDACVMLADALLAQVAAFIEQIDDAAYTRACALASGGTIGKHVRHCVDHYAAAIAGLQDHAAVIDYDHRERDVPMETCRTTAARAINDLRRALAAAQSGPDQRVIVRMMVCDDGRTVDLGSTVGRELAFAAHHALHHHAIMKFIADSFGCLTPSGFGRAPSTAHHERRVSGTLSV